MNRLLLAITLIGVLAQNVRTKPHVTSFPPADVFVDAIVNHTTTAVEKTRTMVRNALMEILNNEEYAEHRGNLTALLQQADDFKKPGLCIDKMLPFSQGFKTFLVPYFFADASDEHKIVLDVLMANGLEDLKVDFEEFIKLVKSGKFGRPVKPGTPGYFLLMEKRC